MVVGQLVINEAVNYNYDILFKQKFINMTEVQESLGLEFNQTKPKQGQRVFNVINLENLIRYPMIGSDTRVYTQDSSEPSDFSETRENAKLSLVIPSHLFDPKFN